MTVFSGKTVWLFDLDKTLYHPDTAMFPYLIKQGRAVVADMLNMPYEQVDKMFLDYSARYGVAFRGLHLHHPQLNMDEMIHRTFSEAPLEDMIPDAAHKKMIDELPGKKVIFTNGAKLHAERVLKHLGLYECFDAIFDVVQQDFQAKPALETYEHVLKALDVRAEECVMVEDTAENLKPAHNMGMATALVHTPLPEDNAFIDAQFDTLNAFLETVHAELKK